MPSRTLYLIIPLILIGISANLILTGCAIPTKKPADSSLQSPASPAEKTSDAAAERPAFKIQYSDVAEALEKSVEIQGGSQPLSGRQRLVAFYKERDFKPAWIDDKGLRETADNFIRILDDAESEGLRPSDYRRDEIAFSLSAAYQDQTAQNFARLDMILTDAYLLYGSDLINGRVNPESVDGNWLVKHREENLTSTLNAALESNRLKETLEGFIPHELGYRTLRETLSHYRQIAKDGGWAQIPKGEKLSKGQRDIRVLVLRARLLASRDLRSDDDGDSDLFDDALESALMNFQRRHGLLVDGVPGEGTIDALNVPVEKRIEQIAINMERWRWLPDTLGERYVLVNIANYELYAVESGETVLSMRVVVGKPYWNTPVFGSKLTYIVLNPTWGIPQTIFSDEILPKIQKNPNVIARDKIKVFEDKGGVATEVDPATIDWASVSKDSFKYRLRQEPGPRNPLGQIKFIFPNRFDVFLHDTTSKHLFQRRERNFSHGCIRLEKPFDLAEYALGKDSGWTAKKIKAAIGGEQPQSIRLPKPLPIYLVYFTAWVDVNGDVEFREDIYGRDKPLGKALADNPKQIPST